MTTPGVTLTVASSKATPRSVGRYDACYVLVHSPTATVASPYFVRTLEEYTEVFGATLSSAAIALYFEQRHGYGLYVINVAASPERTLSISSVTVGIAYTLTLDGVAFSTTAVEGDTEASILSRIATEVNTTYLDVAVISGDALRTSATTVVGSGIVVSAETAAPAYPTYNDVNASLARLPEGLGQGFLCAPEYFEAFSNTNRVLLASALEAFCSAPERLWSYIIDSTKDVASGLGFVNKALSDRGLFSSPSGCGSYEYPHLIDPQGTLVAPSLAKVGLTFRRWRNEDFTQPGAGAATPVYGVSGPSVEVGDTAQAVLNPVGVNVFRGIPYQSGTYSWGARTISTDPNWTWTTTRVILNSLAKQLEAVVRGLVFTTATNTGTAITQTKSALMATASEYYRAGALWGESLTDGFELVMDESNNSPTTRDAGNLVVDAYVKPAPLVEQVQLTVTRVPLGLSFTDYLSTLSNVEQPTAETQTSGDTSATTTNTSTTGGSN